MKGKRLYIRVLDDDDAILLWWVDDTKQKQVLELKEKWDTFKKKVNEDYKASQGVTSTFDVTTETVDGTRMQLRFLAKPSSVEPPFDEVKNGKLVPGPKVLT
jgi:hypothetical protein